MEELGAFHRDAAWVEVEGGDDVATASRMSNNNILDAIRIGAVDMQTPRFRIFMIIVNRKSKKVVYEEVTSTPDASDGRRSHSQHS